MQVIEQRTLEALSTAARKYTSQEINWEQRLYEVAKDIYIGCVVHGITTQMSIEDYAITRAEEFINKLREQNGR